MQVIPIIFRLGYNDSNICLFAVVIYGGSEYITVISSVLPVGSGGYFYTIGNNVSDSREQLNFCFAGTMTDYAVFDSALGENNLAKTVAINRIAVALKIAQDSFRCFTLSGNFRSVNTCNRIHCLNCVAVGFE